MLKGGKRVKVLYVGQVWIFSRFISYNRASVSSAYGNNIIITGKDWHRLKENIVQCNSLDHVHMVVAIVVQFCQRVAVHG